MKYFTPFFALLAVSLSGCTADSPSLPPSSGTPPEHLSGAVYPTTDHMVSLESLVKFRSAYVGDNSNTTQLFDTLWQFDLNDRTYRIITDIPAVVIQYERDLTIEEMSLKKMLSYSSIAAFALIDNLQEIRYEWPSVTYTITRADVEAIFPPPLSDLLTDSTWESSVIAKLQDTTFLNTFYDRFSQAPTSRSDSWSSQ